jgi:hypothetical protein
MMDVIYLGILGVAFGATYGLLKVCEWLLRDNRGERS